MEGFKKYPDVFSVPVKGANGEEMFLKQFEGKILVFVNTTGHCGNARQWPILDMLQKEYADKNVQMVYLPTNDYCGSVTFGDYKNGIKDGKESAEYAKATYDIDAPFTELLSSRNEP
jgi:glutathione peroxidase-family protein